MHPLTTSGPAARPGSPLRKKDRNVKFAKALIPQIKAFYKSTVESDTEYGYTYEEDKQSTASGRTRDLIRGTERSNRKIGGNMGSKQSEEAGTSQSRGRAPATMQRRLKPMQSNQGRVRPITRRSARLEKRESGVMGVRQNERMGKSEGRGNEGPM